MPPPRLRRRRGLRPSRRRARLKPPPSGKDGRIAGEETSEDRSAADGRSSGNSFGRALLAALVWVVLLTIVGIAVAADDAGDAGYVFGQLLVAGLIAGLVTWLITRNAKRRWPFWQLVLLALPFFLIVRLISVAGQASS